MAQVGTLGTSCFASNPPAANIANGGFGAEPPAAQVASGFYPRWSLPPADANVGFGADGAVAAAKAERLFSVSESGPWLSMIENLDF